MEPPTETKPQRSADFPATLEFIRRMPANSHDKFPRQSSLRQRIGVISFTRKQLHFCEGGVPFNSPSTFWRVSPVLDAPLRRETAMRKLVLIGATAIGAAILSASPISVRWSAESLSISQDKALARVGNPATPGSVAGVHRRHGRRAVRRCAAGVTCPHY